MTTNERADAPAVTTATAPIGAARLQPNEEIPPW